MKSRAIDSMKRLPLFVMSTDTIPGIFCRIQDDLSALKIFSLKKREEAKPLCIYAHDFSPYIIKEDLTFKFLQHMEGSSVTVALKASPLAPKTALSGGFTGIRIIEKGHPLALILEDSGLCLLGTSANFSGQKEPSSILEVSPEILSEAPAIFLEEENAPLLLASSLVKKTSRSIIEPSFPKVPPVIEMPSISQVKALPSSVVKIDGRRISILREGKNIEKIISWIYQMKGGNIKPSEHANEIKTFII